MQLIMIHLIHLMHMLIHAASHSSGLRLLSLQALLVITTVSSLIAVAMASQ